MAPALRHSWLAEFLARRVLPLDSPGLDWLSGAFDDDDDDDDAPERPSPAEALAAALADFPEDEHGVLLLAAIDRWTRAGRDGLLSFLVLPYGEFLPQAVGTLGVLGLHQHAQILMAAAARFGTETQTPKERYRRWSDGRGTILDPALDADVRALSEQFFALPRLLHEAAARAEATPLLIERYTRLRQGLSEDERVQLVINQLFTKMGHDENFAKILDRMKKWSKAEIDFLVTTLFYQTISSHSFYDFFTSFPGNFAPELRDAFHRWDRPEAADILAAGMALFPTPYPRDDRARQSFADQQGEAFEATVDDLEDFDENALHDLRYRIARNGRLLAR